MKKSICRLFLCLPCAALLFGCKTDKNASDDSAPEKVELVVWGAEEDTQLMNTMIQNFQNAYRDQADFQISFEVQGKRDAKTRSLAD